MSKPVFWEKQEKYFNMSAAENFLRVLSVNDGTDVCIVLSRLVTNVDIC